jgi:hypothetical protein
MVALDIGVGMLKDGEIGTVGYLLKIGAPGRNIRSIDASPYLCLICLGMNIS